MMGIQVEFFGVARLRAGIEAIELECASGEVSLGEIFGALELKFPQWADECLEGGRLRNGFVANVDGQRFVSDAAARIQDGQSLLIMSADAGG